MKIVFIFAIFGFYVVSRAAHHSLSVRCF